MNNALLVGIGGFIGSMVRYWMSSYVQQLTKHTVFPLGTLAVNVLGCFMIGVLSQLAEDYGIFTSEARLLMFTGFLGAFTTFSAFGNETMNLLREGQTLLALGNITGHIVLGLGAVWLARSLVYLMWT